MIYYAHDLPKMQRWHRQTQFVTDQMAQIIQSHNRRITIDDLINAGKMAYLTIFPGETMLAKKMFYYPLGYVAAYGIFYVKGVGENKTSVIWSAYFAVDGYCNYTARNGVWYQFSSTYLSLFKSKSLTDATSTQIHPKLRIKQGETKIIVECALEYVHGRYYADGTPCSSRSFREAFGFLIFSPSCVRYPYGSWTFHSFFHSVTIFTPKPGLFSDTAPSLP